MSTKSKPLNKLVTANYKKLTTQETYELGLLVKTAIQKLVVEYQLPNTFNNLEMSFIKADPVLYKGFKARQELFLVNMAFAFHKTGQFEHAKLDFESAFSESLIGLMRGVELFDPEKGYAISTYLGWWVKQSHFTWYRKQRNSIKIPQTLSNLLISSKNAAFAFQRLHGVVPTRKQLAAFMEVDEELLKEASSLPLEVSLDETTSNEEGLSKLEKIPAYSEIEEKEKKLDRIHHLIENEAVENPFVYIFLADILDKIKDGEELSAVDEKRIQDTLKKQETFL